MLQDDSSALDLRSDREPASAPGTRTDRCAPRRARTTGEQSSTQRIEVMTHHGTHRFTDRDRLWVRGTTKSESRPAAELRAGDLVAFLGRLVAVRIVQGDDQH